MLHLDPLEPRTPQLPRPRFGALTQLGTSAALHFTLVMIAALVSATAAPGIETRHPVLIADQRRPDIRHVVFLAPDRPQKEGGGGGGGNQQAAPIRRAEGVGSDAITLRVRKPPATPASLPPTENVSAIPAVVLDAKPLSWGIFDQIGLPTGGVLSGASTGPGSGGGVGTGVGTGIGSGQGPGLGPGSGTGGGVYRPGGAVSGPRLIKEVKPTYTNDALRHKIQGAVVLEAVVTVDGCPSQIRVIRSLDAGGLDAQAVAAVAQWQFEPGRLAGTPVDVLVTIQLDFRIW
jgi:periplasmic protein TonB